jgi:lipid-A-disaccharide synthase-like uncharacterized protein
MTLFFFLATVVDFFGFAVTVHPWKIVGWTGNLIFGTRFLLQWIATERAGRSVIPRSFWVVSSIGSLCLLSYFAFYQKDSVGILSVAFPLPIYLRNLYLQCRPRTAEPQEKEQIS